MEGTCYNCLTSWITIGLYSILICFTNCMLFFPTVEATQLQLYKHDLQIFEDLSKIDLKKKHYRASSWYNRGYYTYEG